MSSTSDPNDYLDGTRLESVEEIRQATGVARTPTFKENAASLGTPTARGCVLRFVRCTAVRIRVALKQQGVPARQWTPVRNQ